jgi:hypothetical protein
MFTTNVVDIMELYSYLDSWTGLLGRPAPLPDEWHGGLGKLIEIGEGVLEKFPMSPAFRGRFRRLRITVEQDGSQSDAARLVEELRYDLAAELKSYLFLAIEPTRAPDYNTPDHYFGPDLVHKFRKSEDDLRAASRCLALDEGTACVFHLMRATEVALQKWARSLGIGGKFQNGITYAKEIDILREAKNAIDAIESRSARTPASGSRKKARVRRERERWERFHAIKDAWRNEVMHARSMYSPNQAAELQQAVRAFLRTF